MDRVGKECLYNMMTLVILCIGVQWPAEHSEKIFPKDPWVHILSFAMSQAMSQSLGTYQDDPYSRLPFSDTGATTLVGRYGKPIGSDFWLSCIPSM